MHHILSAANERGIFIQFHTGLLRRQSWNVSNSIELLENLFSKYPRVKFDLFHIGYPYWGVTAALAKTYPNVFIDMCWSHIISPVSARNALSIFWTWCRSTRYPVLAGTMQSLTAIYGHLKIARENIARVLAEKIGDRILTVSQAVRIAERFSREQSERNPP